MCAPQEKQNEVLDFYHSFGHPGGSKLFSIVRQRCLFELKRFALLELFLKGASTCYSCQAVKGSTNKRPVGTLDYWPISEDIWQILAMDFLSLPVC